MRENAQKSWWISAARDGGHKTSVTSHPSVEDDFAEQLCLLPFYSNQGPGGRGGFNKGKHPAIVCGIILCCSYSSVMYYLKNWSCLFSFLFFSIFNWKNAFFLFLISFHPTFLWEESVFLVCGKKFHFLIYLSFLGGNVFRSVHIFFVIRVLRHLLHQMPVSEAMQCKRVC